MTGRRGSRSQHVCYCCDSTTTYIDPRNKQAWHLNRDLEGNALCHRCYSHFYSNSWRNYPQNHLRYRANYKAKHHDRLIERDRKRNKTPERLARQRIRLKLWRDKLFDILGRKCVGCGFDSNIELLQFDHINGGGLKDVIKLLGSRKRNYTYYKYYVDRPKEAKDKLQTLCIKCNWVKKFPADYMTEEWIISLTKWKKYRIDVKDKLFELIGGWKCVICGDEDKRALQIDHRDGGGCKDRKQLGNSTDRFYKYYLEHPEESKKKLRVLCVVCNNN